MLKIRLQRTGRKKVPFYRVVVAEHTAAVQGKVIDRIGSYNPLIKPWAFEVNTEKLLEWIKKGAKPSNTVARLLKSADVKDMDKYIVEMKDKKKKKEKDIPKDEAKMKGQSQKEQQETNAPVAEDKPAEDAPSDEKPAEEPAKEEEKPAEEESKPDEKPKEEESKSEDDKEEPKTDEASDDSEEK